MQKIKLFSLLIITLLAGCGGSEKSSESISSSSENENFRIKAMRYNKCDVTEPFANANVFFHNSNGDVVANHTTNDDGVVEITLPNNAKHFSIVEREDANEEVSAFSEIVTVLDVGNVDHGDFYFYDSSDCNCTNTTLNFDNLTSVYGDDYFVRTNFSTYNSARSSFTACKESGPIDMILFNKVTGDVRSALITITDETHIDVSEEMFDGQATLIEFPNVSSGYTKQVSGFIDNRWRIGFTNYTFDNDPLYSFQDHAGKSRASIYNRVDYNENGVDISLLTLASQSIPENGVLGEFELLEFDANFLSSLQDVSNSFNNSSSVKYDFRAVSDKLDTVNIDLSFYNPDDELVAWRISGPPNTEIPNLRFDNELSLDSIHAGFRLRIRLNAFQFDGSYRDFWRASAARQNVSKVVGATDDFLNLSQLRIDVN